MSFWKRVQTRNTEASHAHDAKAAYERGRRDERASRKRHPFLMTGLVVLAAIGASMVTMAAVKGSFSQAGAMADNNIAAAAESTAPAVQNAVTGAADAAKEAGAEIKDKGADLVSRDKG